MGKLTRSKSGRGVSFSHDSLTLVSAHETVRCLRDQIAVEALDTIYSTRLIVHSDTRPMRGIVRAVGPGHYPPAYLDADGDRLPDHRRDRRKKKAHGERFQPTEVKVGDIVHLGSREGDGLPFDTFIWGDKLMVCCREADVCGVE